MKLLANRPALGEIPHYFSTTHDADAPTIRELLDRLGIRAPQVDLEGLWQHFNRMPDGDRTSIEGVKLLPSQSSIYLEEEGHRIGLRELPQVDGELLPLLENATTGLLDRVRNPAVALSGGLDSALVLALVQRLATRPIPVVTLATGLPGYCELETTLATAKMLGMDRVEVLECREEDFVSKLPATIQACETPLYNLHPVSKLLIAEAIVARGYDALLTGDGADQVFAASDPRNYLPIVGSIFRQAGVALLSPFLDERVIAWSRRRKMDPGKTVLRQAASVVLPAELIWRKKRPRLAPDFDLNRYRDPGLELQLADRLGVPLPDARPGPGPTLWATTALLLRYLGGTW